MSCFPRWIPGLAAALLIAASPDLGARERVFLSAQGDTIPSIPANRSYRLVDGTPDYVLGPDDLLELTLRVGPESDTETSRILPDGTVSFSVAQNVPVATLTLTGASNLMREVLGRYIRNPRIRLLVSEYRSKQASVFGAINTIASSVSGRKLGPGAYPLTGRMTALDLVLEAGGPTSDARLDQVQLIRANRTYVLDLQRAISAGDNTSNPYLEDGDVLRVAGIAQADRRVAVLGEVRDAGVFNLSSQANMLEAIAASRGFNETASANRIRVLRRTDPNNAMILTVNAERILKGDLSQNIGLIDGDIIVVPRDYLADLGDLIGDLQPILAWGGLVRTEPLIDVGGYSVNSPTTTLTLPQSQTAGGTPSTSTISVQQMVDQVQQNLRTPPLR